MDNLTEVSQEELNHIHISLQVVAALQALYGFERPQGEPLPGMTEDLARAFLRDIAKKAQSNAALRSTITLALGELMHKLQSRFDALESWFDKNQIPPKEELDLLNIYKKITKATTLFMAEMLKGDTSETGQQHRAQFLETAQNPNLSRLRQNYNNYTIEAAADKVKQITETLARVERKAASEYVKPLDKVSDNIFDPETSKQIATKDGLLNVRTSPNGAKKVSCLLSLDFAEIERYTTLTQELTPFDRLVYEIIGSLVEAGNKYITLGMIHTTMNPPGVRASKEQLKRIKDSVEKMRRTGLTIDNSPELAAKYKYPRFKYSNHLIPYGSVEVINQGQVTDFALEVTDQQLPLFRFAAGRGQIARAPIKLLWTKSSNTDKQLKLQSYLYTRIARAQKEGAKKVILLGTLFDKLGITKDKKRTIDKAKVLLKHFKTLGIISGYDIGSDRITWTTNRD